MQIFHSIYLEFVRKLVAHLPGVNEKLCFETPAFYAGDKLFARFKEDGETLVIYTEERERWMENDPETFFITDHYKNYKYMLIALGSVKKSVLTELLTEAWKKRAAKRLLKEFDIH